MTIEKSELPDTGRKRVLIIEDEMMMASMLDDMLNELGYETAGMAQNFDNAINKIEHESFDAAILDVNLNGHRTLADILHDRNLPFVFSTGYNQESLPEVYRNFPALQKPYTMAQLGTRLETILV
jgi:DNA-binding response OmpR family regulator